MADIIRIENLYKSFGEVKAVQNLSFKVKEGELFAFLGVNGAGKSTTISILSTFRVMVIIKRANKTKLCGQV